MKISLFGLNLDELRNIAETLGMTRYSASQIGDWLYQKRADEIDEITNLSKINRQNLNRDYCVGLSKPIKQVQSVDLTKKYLFRTEKNFLIESAFIPHRDRATICVSTQSGCRMNCAFCLTGKQGLQGHLTAGEILNQIRSIDESQEITNVVFMGMGEPFDNIDETLKSIEILTSAWGFAWSARRLTVSTVGIIPSIEKFITRCNANLAISLHTPFHEQRKELMPVENAYPIEDVIKIIKNFNFERHRKLSFEYIMLKGVNDSPKHINGLTKLLNGLNCNINLIKFHSSPDSPFKSCTYDEMAEFAKQLNNKNFLTTIRHSCGEDISAACGMLSTKEQQINNK